MTNYGEDERRRHEMCERFEHAINCMDISTISMMAFERIAKENNVSLTSLLQTMLLNALEDELNKDKDTYTIVILLKDMVS
tara:strand:+ start:22 stop:264 length:243 start_codon:yes stop_codon:yes gene_type:complete